MLRTIDHPNIFQRAVGESAALWLKFVYKTSRFITEPPDLLAPLQGRYPYIVAMWHGQSFLVPFMRPHDHRYRVLVSRHATAQIGAIALSSLGVELIRGSGGRATKQHQRGGPAALRAMLATLESGVCVGSTADVPRKGYVAGPGIVTLARLSGCPIVPVAAATSSIVTLDSWDKAAISLPFSRGAFVVGDLIDVPADADEAICEAKRLDVQRALDAVHEKAYELVGRRFTRPTL